MWEPEDLTFSPEEFSGTARLFPLPNLVLFPHVMQPLHVFEQRYRDLVENALAGDRLLAIGLLKPGWESNYEGRPPVASVACLGRIVSHQRQEDGRLNIMLLGLHRIRLLREKPPIRSYREVEAQLLDDSTISLDDALQNTLQRKLLCGFKQILPDLPGEFDQLDEFLEQHIPLGVLTDIVGYTLDLDVTCKQQLLAEVCIERRAQTLLRHLGKVITEKGLAPAMQREFPPKFSVN